MFPNSCLIQYQGGGYDGCIYELNYAYIDADGEFHNIASTGYKGCDTLGKLQDTYSRRPDDFDIYPLPAEAERFSDQAPISHLLGIARWFWDNGPSIVFQAKCDECGERCNVLEEQGDSPHGIGGIMQEYQHILCPDCVPVHCEV